MEESNNLKKSLEKHLPSPLMDFLRLTGVTASQTGHRIYLVGGVVRDLLLERINTDLDLAIEGDAIAFTREIAKIRGAKVVAHSRFNTAKFKWERWDIDIAATRTEYYPQPGDLPVVEGKTDIYGDLRRRDFSINSMAIRLDPDHFGEIIDIYNGRKDLKAGLIRVLHPLSFQEDATRIWRALRYEQRLNFQIENETRALILKDIAFIDKLSPDRQRNELELCLEEKSPEKVLARAVELGLFGRLIPSWQVAPGTFQNIQKVRTLMLPDSPPHELYLAILFFGMNHSDLQLLIKRFNFNRSASSVLQDCLILKDSFSALSEAGLSNGQIYHLLNKINQISLLAAGVILDRGIIKERIDLYLNQLRQVKTMISGYDLLKAGYPPGPEIGQILEKLKEARLEGRVTSLEDEKALLKQISQADG